MVMPLTQLEPGRTAFNRGAYFEAHELWEDVWRTLDGPERTVVQGLIQIAAGLHHLQEGRPGPAGRLMRKGIDKLASQSAPTAGFRMDLLTDDVAKVLAQLDSTNAPSVLATVRLSS